MINEQVFTKIEDNFVIIQTRVKEKSVQKITSELILTKPMALRLSNQLNNLGFTKYHKAKKISFSTPESF